MAFISKEDKYTNLTITITRIDNDLTPNNQNKFSVNVINNSGQATSSFGQWDFETAKKMIDETIKELNK